MTASRWTIRLGNAEDAPRALEIWRAAVDATHGFLSAEDRQSIDAMMGDFLPQAPLTMVCADDVAQGFMIMVDDKIEALFIDPAVHGEGAGSALIAHALERAPAAFVDANAQADNALPFYLAKGFVEIGRSPRDDAGRPYPTVHLQYRGAA